MRHIFFMTGVASLNAVLTPSLFAISPTVCLLVFISFILILVLMCKKALNHLEQGLTEKNLKKIDNLNFMQVRHLYTQTHHTDLKNLIALVVTKKSMTQPEMYRVLDIQGHRIYTGTIENYSSIKLKGMNKNELIHFVAQVYLNDHTYDDLLINGN